jgi:hypothetical protein
MVPVVNAIAKGAEGPLGWRIGKAGQQVLKLIAMSEGERNTH